MEKPSENMEDVLRSSVIVAGGFLGMDSRNIDEIINSDLAELAEIGFTAAKLVTRMIEITNAAIPALGNTVKIDEKHEARVDEAKGNLTCPWPDSCRCAKRVTFVRNTETGQIARWTDLNIHFIEVHNFFEGKGSAYRIEPKELVKIIF